MADNFGDDFSSAPPHRFLPDSVQAPAVISLKVKKSLRKPTASEEVIIPNPTAQATPKVALESVIPKTTTI